MNPPTLPQLHVLQRKSGTKFAELDADAMPTLQKLKLDTTRTTYVGTKSGLAVYLTDIEVGQRRREPALLIANKSNPTERNAYVRLSELHQVIDPVDPIAARNQAIAINALAERLFGFVTRDDCFKLLDALYDFAQDLVHARPPTWIAANQWLDAAARDDLIVTMGGHALNG